MKITGSIVLSLAAVVTAVSVPRSGTPLTQAQAQSQLQAAGITSYSSGGCTTKSISTCTSYDGLLSGTANALVTLKNACACTLVVTGGTEVGHASGTYSHSNGYKVDLRHNTALDSYVKNSFAKIGNRGDGYPQWQAASGNIYCDEGSHWDITVY